MMAIRYAFCDSAQHEDKSPFPVEVEFLRFTQWLWRQIEPQMEHTRQWQQETGRVALVEPAQLPRRAAFPHPTR